MKEGNFNYKLTTRVHVKVACNQTPMNYMGGF